MAGTSTGCGLDEQPAAASKAASTNGSGPARHVVGEDRIKPSHGAAPILAGGRGNPCTTCDSSPPIVPRLVGIASVFLSGNGGYGKRQPARPHRGTMRFVFH